MSDRSCQIIRCYRKCRQDSVVTFLHDIEYALDSFQRAYFQFDSNVLKKGSKAGETDYSYCGQSSWQPQHFVSLCATIPFLCVGLFLYFFFFFFTCYDHDIPQHGISF